MPENTWGVNGGACKVVAPRDPPPTTSCDGATSLLNGCSLPFVSEEYANYDRISGQPLWMQMAANADEIGNPNPAYVNSGLAAQEKKMRDNMSPTQLEIKDSCTMEIPCNNHDKCYNTCYPDTWGTANPNKGKCDSQLKADMRAQCDNCMNARFGTNYTAQRAKLLKQCYRKASLYKKGVGLGGLSSYKEGQRNACCCKKKR